MPVNNDSKMFANVCERGENYIISSKPQNILDTENKMAIMALKAYMPKNGANYEQTY